MGFARFLYLYSGTISLTSRFHLSEKFRSIFHTACQPSYRLNQFEGLGPRLSSVLNTINHSERKDPERGAAIDSAECAQSMKQENDKAGVLRRQVEVYHPWAEWIDLVDRLAKGSYFNAIEEDDNADDVVDDVRDGSKEDKKVLKALRGACRRFGHERFDIFSIGIIVRSQDNCPELHLHPAVVKGSNHVFADLVISRCSKEEENDRSNSKDDSIFGSLSRRDIQVIVGSGCPSLDGKVVNSAKRLRAYVNLNEGDVCSSCTLRASCEQAYVMPRREDTARTVDVMQVLMTCAYHPLIGFSKHKIQMRKNVKASACKLLKQVVELSATPLDPNLPKPTFVGPPSKVKKSQPFRRKKLGRDDIAKLRGDWQCPRCDFMNFAKNSQCLQCDEIRPKPKLHQGEWECPGCGYINYKKNLACHRCECNNPRNGYTNSSRHSTQQFPFVEWKWKKPVD